MPSRLAARKLFGARSTTAGRAGSGTTGCAPANRRHRHFRAIFISDLHLGTRGCQAQLVLDFLEHNDSDQLYLVGDILDGWQLKRSWYWPQSHNDVVQKILSKGRNGTKIIYLPGNHDEFLRDYAGVQFGGVEVVDQTIHHLADGRRLLILHGDQFDIVVRYAPWLAMLGSTAYLAAMSINAVVNRIRRRLGWDYWSLSAWAKAKVKNAVRHIGHFEEALASEARRRDADGVVCGHIHHAKIGEKEGFVYVNSGDWVESCTAVAEHHDGRLELIRWRATSGEATLPREQPQPMAEAAE